MRPLPHAAKAPPGGGAFAAPARPAARAARHAASGRMGQTPCPPIPGGRGFDAPARPAAGPPLPPSADGGWGPSVFFLS